LLSCPRRGTPKSCTNSACGFEPWADRRRELRGLTISQNRPPYRATTGAWPTPFDRRRVLIEATERARRVGYEAYGPIAEAVMASEHRFTHEQPEGILAFLELGRELNVGRPRRSETRQARGDAAVSVRLEHGPRRLGTEFMWLICGSLG